MDTISALVSISGSCLLWTHSGFHQMAMTWIGGGSVGGAVAAAVGGSVLLLRTAMALCNDASPNCFSHDNSRRCLSRWRCCRLVVAALAALWRRRSVARRHYYGLASLWLGGVTVARRRSGDGGVANNGTAAAALCGTMVRMISEACLQNLRAH
jgi:hypothetical protein